MIEAGRQFAICLALVAIAALAGAGCGSSGGGDYGGQHPDYAKALAGSPPPLAALHKQADQLLSGGSEAFDKRIAALHGYPAVVNVWASWCGPCRFEFPTLQKLSATYGKRVAFLGIDSQDSDDAAMTFLEEAPVPYPSYTDPSQEIGGEIGATRGLPDTAFYDREGNLTYLKQGPYTDHSELREDIERYALGQAGSSESG
ncbi:MAG TPA: TlpA disulfide reductase family protein [Solirubrobacterales bacterium]|nr:TlpA disulfide reductase family protein [Solirubrobacterales bacterium]